MELDSPQSWTSAITRIRDELHATSNMDWDDYRTRIYNLPEYNTFRQVKEDPLKTEQVYLMVSLLNNRWGPISRVEQSVLELFHNLLPMNGYRSLEFFASCFKGIQRGEVRVANVPNFERSSELRRHIIVPMEWSRESIGEPHFVEIETRIR
jgi:hypothetical protein